MRILVVEDDLDTADFLTRRLRRHGYEAHSVDTGVCALRTYQRADLVLLDLELPDIDGLEVCRGIRAAGDTPIIVVTSRGTELDRVLGLQAGSDDYLVKPYGFRELVARIDAVMRRAGPRFSRSRSISRGRLHLDSATREVRVDGRPVTMTRKEFDFLHLLASQPGTVFSRQQIMMRVWHTELTRFSRTIDTHASSLRGKLGAGTWIVAVRGVGFRLGSG